MSAWDKTQARRQSCLCPEELKSEAGDKGEARSKAHRKEKHTQETNENLFSKRHICPENIDGPSGHLGTFKGVKPGVPPAVSW